MTRAENEAIEIFCRALALEIRQITGSAFESMPDWLVGAGESDQQRSEDPLPPSATNDLYPF